MADVRTKADYSAYEQRVKDFIEREQIQHLSTSCQEWEFLGVTGEEVEGEPWFSWSPCRCCQSSLGGMREYLYARDAENKLVQFTICEDCVYYVNYGRLDDTTMLDIERSAV
jgi:hypothetical protein